MFRIAESVVGPGSLQLGEHPVVVAGHLGGDARVVLPIGQERRGKVKIDVGGQPTYMVALPFRSDLDELAQGDQVVVVEVKEGTAYVIPFPG